MNEQKQNRIGCFLCGNGLDVRASKRNKPYLVCEPCGIQIFIRRQQGIDRLVAKQKAYGGQLVVGQREADEEIVSLANRLVELKAKLREIEDNEPILAGFLTEEHPAKVPLRAQIRSVGKQLKEVSARSD